MKLTTYCLGLLLAIFFFSSCATSRQGRSMKSKIDGSWTLQTINTEGINANFKATVFNEADMNCFVGSNWNFEVNNSTGTYSLIGGTSGCATLQRNIRWTIYEPKDEPQEFQFKRLDEKKNPLDDNNGFRLSVSMLDETTMQLKSTVTFEGKPGYIVYNFTKKQI